MCPGGAGQPAEGRQLAKGKNFVTGLVLFKPLDLEVSHIRLGSITSGDVNSCFYNFGKSLLMLKARKKKKKLRN